ncbi:MAG: chromate transporter [Clostridiaceae bacterium]|nr:chromate transporter [Eubacteriales bacterium]
MEQRQKTNLKTLWELFVIFFKAGTFTFAGGLAMLPVIERDIVEKNKLMPREEFLEYATLSQTLPGVIAVNCAAFVGRRAAGTKGMLAASFGATVSAFVLMVLATVLLGLIPREGPLYGAFEGIRAASSALILAAAFSLGRHNIKNLFSVALMLAAFFVTLLTDVSVPLVVLGGAAIGVVYARLAAAKKKKGGKGDVS